MVHDQPFFFVVYGRFIHVIRIHICSAWSFHSLHMVRIQKYGKHSETCYCYQWHQEESLSPMLQSSSTPESWLFPQALLKLYLSNRKEESKWWGGNWKLDFFNLNENALWEIFSFIIQVNIIAVNLIGDPLNEIYAESNNTAIVRHLLQAFNLAGTAFDKICLYRKDFTFLVIFKWWHVDFIG